MAAAISLSRAQAIAWRLRDSPSLARRYLPLLEARRQIRQTAVDGVIFITLDTRQTRAATRHLRAMPAGTLIAGGAGAPRAASQINFAARAGPCLEALLLLERRGETHLVSAADPRFAAGLEIQWTTSRSASIQPGQNVFVLPPAGAYEPGDPLHAIARETLLLAWEALALHLAGASAFSAAARLRVGRTRMAAAAAGHRPRL